MLIQNSPFALISAFYFLSWLMLVVLFMLSGVAQVSGGALVLFLLIKILTSLEFTT